MVMLTDFNQKIIPDYSPISARGGSKARRSKKDIHVDIKNQINRALEEDIVKL